MEILKICKKFKKKVFSRKTKIVLSSIVVLLNCFLWKNNIKPCNALNKNVFSLSNQSSDYNSLGTEVFKLDSWKNCSYLSCLDLKTYFKQSGQIKFEEIKWKLKEIVNSNPTFINFSPLIERISELRKCRINSKIQLEEIFLSGIKSCWLENHFPKSCSIQDVLDKTYIVLKNGGLSYDKFQNGESLRSLVNYFPGLKSLIDNSAPFPNDNGRGFTFVRFFSGKGSPFFKKVLGAEFLNGYNIPSNSTKAATILIEDVCRDMSKKKFSIELNKKANAYKTGKHQKLYKIKILNFVLKKQKFIFKKVDICTKMWSTRFWIKNLEAQETLNLCSTNQQKILDKLEKLSTQILIPNTKKSFHHERISKLIKKNCWSDFNSFTLLFYNSIDAKKKINQPKNIKFRYKSLYKIYLFEKFKKKKPFSSITSKDKIIRVIKKKPEKILRSWKTNKINSNFNSHTLYSRWKNFHPEEIICEKYLFIDAGGKKMNLQGLYHKFNQKHGILKEKISLSKGSTTFKKVKFCLTAKKKSRTLTLGVLKDITNEKQEKCEIEIFNFTKNLCSKKTKDWKTVISFFNRFKLFRNANLLGLFGIILRSGSEIPKSLLQSKKLIVKSAGLGNHNSRITLATYLIRGMGIKKSSKSAFLIFAKTAHEGVSRGSFNILTMLKNGVGVDKDSLRSFKLLKNSRNLITKSRKPYKKFKSPPKNGFLKTLSSNIRSPNEINIINFFIVSLTSPFTSYLGTIIAERALLVATDVNITNTSEKKGSLACKKKLKNLLLENRQQYLFQENSKGLSTSIFGEITGLLLRWNTGLCCIKDCVLFKNRFLDTASNFNFFHYIKITENLLTVCVYQIFQFLILSWIRFKDFCCFYVRLIRFIQSQFPLTELDHVRRKEKFLSDFYSF